MIDYSERHAEVPNIIFDAPDRMTRNDFDKVKIVRLIQDFDKTIHFARTNKRINKESGSDDEFLFDIEVAVAKKWSKDISHKASMGMQEKVNQGDFSGTAPLGYINNTITKLIEIDDEKAPFIKRAFELMATGNYSIEMLAAKLYAEGLRTKKGKRVGKSTLSTYLKNPIYYGWLRWKGQLYEGNQTPIITKLLWNEVQTVLSGRRSKARITKRGYPFNGIARCAICNCTILGETAKEHYLYYHCGFSKGRHKGAAYIPVAQMVSIYGEAVKAVTLPTKLADWVMTVIQDTAKDDGQYRAQRLAVCEREQTKLKSRLVRLYDQLFDGELDESILRAKEYEYKDRLATLAEERANLESQEQDVVAQAHSILELCKRLYDVYMAYDDPERAKLLRVIGSNYLLDGRSLSVTYNKPFDLLVNLPLRTE